MRNFRIITIPFDRKNEIFNEEELNKFCFNKQITAFRKEFFTIDEKAFWTVFIEYESLQNKDKGKLELNENDKLLFEKLREWRKDKAEKAGVPVYIVNTNEQMMAIIKEKPKTLEGIKTIKGFGKKKIENYGKEILSIIQSYTLKENE